MGNRLIDVFERQLNGEFDDIDELSPEFVDKLEGESAELPVIDGDIVSGE